MSARLIPEGEPATHFRFSGLAALGLPHITTTRHFPGVTSPSEPTAPFNGEAQQALRAARLDPTRLSYLRQVHGAEALLADAGVDRAKIENPRLCTACHPDLLYSYRKGNRGRLVTVAALP